jgi:hypothetical protein
MNIPPRPCSHCGCVTLHVIPNVQVDIKAATTVLGMQAKRDLGAIDWAVTLVVCSQCGLSQCFTTNAAQLAPNFPGSQTINVPQR